MSIVAARCPVCGRDIGFEEGVEEYTCIFCGEKLMTSALIKEPVNGAKKPEMKKYVPPEKRTPSERSSSADYTSGSGSGSRHHSSEHSHSHSHSDGADKPVEPERELTEEEVKEYLEKKTRAKAELHDVVKEIDSLREKRDPLKERLKTTKNMTLYGCIGAGAVILAMIIFYDISAQNNVYVMLGGLVLGATAIFMIVLSWIRRKEIKTSQKRLEKTIGEKKDKRDTLIARLNRINKKLHIHSDN